MGHGDEVDLRMGGREVSEREECLLCDWGLQTRMGQQLACQAVCHTHKVQTVSR
jgi:hypothetical protein